MGHKIKHHCGDCKSHTVEYNEESEKYKCFQCNYEWRKHHRELYTKKCSHCHKESIGTDTKISDTGFYLCNHCGAHAHIYFNKLNI